MYKHRYIEDEIASIAKAFKVVLVVGPRQVGKTTLLKNLFPSYPIITFNPIHSEQDARKDPELFLRQFNGPVILDEVQFAPELLAYIKINVDKSDAPGQYFLTGSQNLSVLKSVAESLAGRVAIVELSPMIALEITESFTTTGNGTAPRHWLENYLADPASVRENAQGLIPDLTVTQAIWRGGYPGLLTVDDRHISRYFTGYFNTYVERDIRTQAEIEQLMKFEDFVALLAAISGQEINYSELGREIAASGKTAQRWLALLRATYMWRDVRPFVGNTIKRVTEKNKGYFVDTGFACYLLGITSPLRIMGHPMFGSLFETYVSNTLFAVLQSLSFRPIQYHWRSKGGAEVDIVLECNNELYPIEIKTKSNLTKNDARGILAFEETYRTGPQKVMPGVIVYTGVECYWVTPTILAVPWNLLQK